MLPSKAEVTNQLTMGQIRPRLAFFLANTLHFVLCCIYFSLVIIDPVLKTF